MENNKLGDFWSDWKALLYKHGVEEVVFLPIGSDKRYVLHAFGVDKEEEGKDTLFAMLEEVEDENL